MQTLAYTISPMSWRFLFSAIERVRERKGSSITPIDFNSEAPPCVILCCIALEAFVNEMSGLTNALLFEEKKKHQAGHSTVIQQEADRGMALVNCQNIGQIKDDPKGSFYDKYKTLLKAAGIKKPNCMLGLVHLCYLRNALVHFRACEIPIVEDSRGVIRILSQSSNEDE